jgi:hypothetical protein
MLILLAAGVADDDRGAVIVDAAADDVADVRAVVGVGRRERGDARAVGVFEVE